ncbi:hypothetical protein H6F42_11575 [Pseudanabaena sp. FACHB-1998]|uniref:hypothetical protein n=1 Tax=Pseudanabaena sp. FACHB-1998 TaxID=2692858 RepID=UPI0016805EB8|nr:hypothetical protein [Pseudanabaena sp. FACHB-1998]MBD2177553.1 hypothetical protein [Pseudanabaena sp. FACHB-1998]
MSKCTSVNCLIKERSRWHQLCRNFEYFGSYTSLETSVLVNTLIEAGIREDMVTQLATSDRL